MNTKTLSIISSLILVSVVFLAACSPIGGAPIVLAQPDTVEGLSVTRSEAAAVDILEEDVLRSWEMDADDIAAAREVAHYLAAVERVSHEISTADISAARQAAHYLAAARQVSGELDAGDIAAASEAAQTLSQTNAADSVDFDAAELVSGELDASDISAARQAAHYLAASRQVSGEMDVGDIASARKAADTLSQTLSLIHI